MISIKKYNDKLQYDWDDFIKKSKYGTIFHNQKFLSYHIEKQFDDFSLFFYKNKILVAVFPAAIVCNNNNKQLISHPGASFGGFICKKNDFTLCFDIINAFEKYCKKNKIVSCKIIPTPSYYATNCDTLLDYVLTAKKYYISERYISHIIYLNDNNPISYFNSRKKRYMKNKFINSSLCFQEIDSVDSFYSILLENKKKFNALPTHSLEEIKKLLYLYPKECNLLGTFKMGKLIGGVFVLQTSTNSALLFYNAVNKNNEKNHIGLFQVYECIKWCLNKKIQVLDLGVSHLPSNKNPLDPKISLIKFKEQCGAVGVMRSVFTKNII